MIGRAIALRLAGLGARVVVGWNKNEVGARQTADELTRIGATFHMVQADLKDPKGPEKLVDEAQKQFGDVHILINNAALDLYALLVDTRYDQLRQLIDVNLISAFLCAQLVLPGMVSSRWGRIVNIGSIWGETGAAGEVAYSAAKAGITGLTKALAKEAAPSGVTVNAVAPGVIDTPMNDGFDLEERKALLSRIPVGRFGTGDDVAKAVSFLVSEEASYVTGHVLWVTGGFDPLPK